MALSPKTIHIGIALFISLVFIAAGYYFSSPLQTNIASATSTEELLKAYAAKDTDSDGLPDWQESLYGTDLQNPHSVDPVLMDKEAVDQGKVEPKFKSEPPPPEKVDPRSIPGDIPVSGSLTERFAKQFFQKFMMSQQVGMSTSPADMQAFVADSVASLQLTEHTPNTFTRADVRTMGAGASALRSYASTLSEGLTTTTSNTGAEKDELSYVYDAVINSDSKALAKVSAIAKAYRNAVTMAKKTPAPIELVDAHVELMNATAQLAESIENMAAFKEDPMRTLLGMSQYQVQGVRFIRAFATMDTIYQQAGVRIEVGEPGYSFYTLLGQASQHSTVINEQLQ